MIHPLLEPLLSESVAPLADTGLCAVGGGGVLGVGAGAGFDSVAPLAETGLSGAGGGGVLGVGAGVGFDSGVGSGVGVP